MTTSRPRRAILPDEPSWSRPDIGDQHLTDRDKETVVFRRAILADDLVASATDESDPDEAAASLEVPASGRRFLGEPTSDLEPVSDQPDQLTYAAEAELLAAKDVSTSRVSDHDGRSADTTAKPRRGVAAADTSAPASVSGRVSTSIPKRSPFRALVIIGVVVLAVIVGLVVWTVGSASSDPGKVANPLVPVRPAPDALLTAEGLTSAGFTGTWQASGTAPVPSDIVCVGNAAVSDGAPRLMSRRLTSVEQPENSVIHLSATFDDEIAATAAYSVALLESGTCSESAVHITSAFSVTGLTDTAAGITFSTQGQSPEKQTILIARTGRTLNIVNVKRTDDFVSAATVAQAVVPTLRNVCAAQGVCPTSVSVSQALPAPDDPAGWLVSADMPLITPTAGMWRWLDRSPMSNVSSQCEGLNLKSVEEASSANQRTLLLTGDPAQPDDFGVDQLVYTFSGVKGAQNFQKALDKNIGSCPKTVMTASVKKGDTVQGLGADEVAITATTYRITHKVGEASPIYRVSVIIVGSKVGYLLANVASDFDFTDSQWQELTLRAGQRISQI